MLTYLVNNTQLCRLFSPEFFMVQLLVLQAPEKPPCWRIIPTIALSAHALLHPHCA